VPDKKSFIVSLHDAHPGSRAQIAEQVAFLAAYGVTRSSILVVPEFHHGASAGASAEFRDAVSAWQAQGHELVLHGYYHDRKEAPRETNLIRLSLHPRDLEFPLLRRQIDQVVRAALKRGFAPTTYGDYVAH
jgi:predicted deacetylase